MPYQSSCQSQIHSPSVHRNTLVEHPKAAPTPCPSSVFLPQMRKYAVKAAAQTKTKGPRGDRALTSIRVALKPDLTSQSEACIMGLEKLSGTRVSHNSGDQSLNQRRSARRRKGPVKRVQMIPFVGKAVQMLMQC